MTAGKILSTVTPSHDPASYLEKKCPCKHTLPEEHLTELLDAAQINVWHWDLATDEITDHGYSESLAVLAGYDSYKEKIGRIENFIMRLHPDDCERVKILLETSFNQHIDYEAEFRIKLLTGNYEWVVSRGRYLKDNNGVPVSMIGSWRFITEQKRIQQLIARQQATLVRIGRAYSLGELASTLAHEISQPLLVLNTYLSGTLRRLRESDIDKKELLAILINAVKQVELSGKIVKRIKRFVSQGELHRENVHFADLFTNIIKIVRYTFPHPVNIQLEIKENLPCVEVDCAQIKQVILNLMVTAHTPQINFPARAI